MNIRLGLFFPFLATCLAIAQTTVIHAGRLLDGKGGAERDKLITIAGGRIQSVANGRGPADIELGKLTVLPGWIDTHVHLDWHFGNDGKLAKPGTDKPEEVVLFDAENAWLTLQGGFTTVQSVGSRADGLFVTTLNWVIFRVHASSPHCDRSIRTLAAPKL